MLSFKTIEPSTQIALMVNPKKKLNLTKTDFNDGLDITIKWFIKYLKENY